MVQTHDEDIQPCSNETEAQSEKGPASRATQWEDEMAQRDQNPPSRSGPYLALKPSQRYTGGDHASQTQGDADPGKGHAKK